MAAAFAARWGQLADDSATLAMGDGEYHNFYAPVDYYAETAELGHDCLREWGPRGR